jgi:hypothetical protein
MKKELSDLRDAQLRAEPDYIDLCKLLDAQSPARKARLAHELTQSQGCEHSHNQGAAHMEAKTRALDTSILALKDAEGLSFSEIAARLNAEGFTNQAGGKFTKKSVGNRYYRLKGKLSSQGAQGCEDSATGKQGANGAKHCEDGQTGEHPANVARRGETERPEPDLANHANGCEDASDHMPDHVSCESCEPCESCENPRAVGLAANDAQLCEACVDEPAKHGDDSQYDLPSHMVATLRKLIREELAAMPTLPANIAKVAKVDVDMPPPTPRVAGTKRFQGGRATLPGTRIDSVLFDRFQSECQSLGLSASDTMQLILWRHFGRPILSFEEPEE